MKSAVGGIAFGEFLILVILIGLSIAIMVLERHDPDHSPLVYIATPLRPLKNLAGAITRVRYLESENSILRGRLTELRYENAMLRERLQRSGQAEKLFEFAQDYPETLVFARVMTYLERRDGGGIIIDKGTGEGITTNMVVITSQGLVGIVTRVGYRASQVKLIDEPGYRVSAMVRRSRSTGIMSATADGRILMEWVAPDAPVSDGDTIVTSGMGLVAPYGIPIGVVAGIELEPQKFSQILEIRPCQDPRHLEQVAVILRSPPDFTRMLGKDKQ